MDHAHVKSVAKGALGSCLAKLLPRAVLLDHRNFAKFERAGYHVTPVHFYAPIPSTDQISSRATYSTTALDAQTTAQQHLLRTVLPYFDEYEWIPNSYFGRSDSLILYGLVRHFVPTRVIEVGSGFSTYCITAALERNQRGVLATVEPYERDRMPAAPTYPVPVQDVPVEVFTSLDRNDILFIDSSHVAKSGSDVTHLILNVLPELCPGVIVHFHDIFLPDDYPPEWIVEQHRFWNEQYLLHAFLTFNTSWRVLLSAHQLVRDGFLDQSDAAGSFWIRRD